MATAQIPLIYDELLDYLVKNATPEEILAFKASDKAEARARDLLDRQNAGTITADERRELEQLLYFDRKISVLKARAAVALNPKPT
jgi:O-methyltransferase involved in polyketide biosynthesis